MNILITGYFGSGNLGDDIMLKVCTKRLRQANINYKVLLFDYPSEKLYLPKQEENTLIIRSDNRFIYKIRLAMQLVKFDALFYVGGTCFTEKEGLGCYGPMLLASLLNLKIGYVGIGFNRLISNDRIAKSKTLLSRSSYISVRDTQSLENIRYLFPELKQIRKYDDLVYQLFSNEINLNVIDEEYILISLRDITNLYGIDLYINMLDEITEFVIKYHLNSSIHVLIVDDSVDFNINHDLYSRLKCKKVNVQFLDKLNIMEKIEQIANAKMYITGRLHAAFISEYYRVPTVVLDYNEKIQSFLRQIGRSQDGIIIENINHSTIEEKVRNNNVKATGADFESHIVDSKAGLDNFINYLVGAL